MQNSSYKFENLAESVPYQEDRWQSKVLSDKSGIKTILFAFMPGQQLPVHTAPLEVVITALEGHAVFTLEDQEHAFGAGSVIRIPAHAPHAVRALSCFKMLLVK